MMIKKTQQASQGNEYWRGTEYAFINHKKCESFPCHATDDPDNFNCLFCYCPLYALGDACGGCFQYTEGGIKDCTGCTIPHDKDNYGYITERFNEIVELTKWVKANKPSK
ncbi:cysteine-rich small domain-containing protein [Dethiobacter alkaliphilus]|uniref:cysteine-rich small domain-containing protein n=1 Tax=Dethiobacter alkaliphilus TaxID=427926 RepID=UPI002227116C|nr:cysteine-rich small domain-containing protein [Dethiobacter alkaliphilus]MCW3488568.1 cysteine-rich small domain-containing protein [Dethiobacter alkaliphilus]